MSGKNNGWNRPEEKYVETELEDNFEAFFAEEETVEVPKGKKRRRSGKAPEAGPDILAVSERGEDSGFVITEVVAVDNGEAVLPVKQEEAPQAEEETKEPEEEKDENPPKQEMEPEAALEQKEEEPGEIEAPFEEEREEAAEEQEEVVDLSLDEQPKPAKEKKFKFFPRAKKIINKKRKHQYAATIGAALIILSIIGSISVISALISFTGRLIENTSQKESFEWKIYPLLMLDPTTFDDPSQLDEVFVLKTALWSTLLENRSIYSYNEQGLLVVPASDLDVAAKKLYGDSVTLNHQTFSEGYEYFYVYDEETDSYSVPISGQTAGYTPKVVKISKSGNIYTLIVGYVAPMTIWNVNEGGIYGESVPDKYLYYILEKVDRDDYIIKSVKSIPASELPSDLEVADYQSINQTQYFDYEQQYQDYLAGLQDEQESSTGDEENTGENVSEDTSQESSDTSSEEE